MWAMRELKLAALSSVYAVRRLDRGDVEAILALCRSNSQYYAYCGKEASVEQIEQDLTIVPPGIPAEQKYYVGFFEGAELAAVMDLVDGYPEEGCAFIGLFMLHGRLQGRGVGSEIMAEVFAYLRKREIRRCQLGIDKDNPQSNRFWKKNGFAVIREVSTDDGTILLAEKEL